MKTHIFKIAITFPGQLNTIKIKYKHDNEIDLSPLKLKLHLALLNNIEKYAKFDDPKHNVLS